ncbi:mechanosensitive ion channel domain-containing protein [Thiohalocapsa sp.]|uniref:mechanosensitive ion channel family protein n=1 Tax=Thiohalocapsa sp. TaxID=2497641 RepID=UPI0025DB214E|nr:mechanosensitive ion channel domain-containing protein [Thiohalocapsa sp.]
MQPAATASPRDTLQSFLAAADKVAEQKRLGDFDESEYHLLRQAIAMLDFSATPDGDDWSERMLRVALLHEVLGRAELPSVADIPSAQAVAAEGITEWDLPGTRIRLERVASGPRAGEFLFSADTVALLDRLYRRAKVQPYRADAVPGIYEQVISLADADGVYERLIRVYQRLEPVDTTSPRTTLNGFLESLNRAYALVMEADAALSAEPPTMSKAEARVLERRAARLLQRAVNALDLRRVPAALREEAGEEAALMLKEVLDRMILPPLDAVPDERAVAAARDGVLGPFLQGDGPLRWRIPNTEIEIIEISEGDRQGEFLFSAITVEDIRHAFDAVRDLPYRKAAFAGTELDYRSADVSPGFYDYFVSTPGHLVPRASVSGELIDRLPGWLRTLYGGQTLWQWAALLLAVPLLVSIVTLLVQVTRRLAKQMETPAGCFVRVLGPIAAAFLVSAGLNFLAGPVHLTGGVLTAITIIGKAVVIALLVWAVFGLSRAIAESVIASPRTRIKEDSIDATMWRIGSRMLGFLLSVAVLIRGMQVLGADVLPLLAGLGVGGLAVALAARETLTDIFGALMILADRPYRIGHWVVIGEYEGTVQSIGIRSTRIRTFYDSVLTIPNSKAVTSVVDNMGMREYRRIKTYIGIRYDTPPERLEAFLEGIKRIIQTNPATRKDYFHVVLNDFGPDHLRILLYCFLEVPDWSAELVERQRILLEIIRLAHALGVQFAFPTQTLEIESFPGQPRREPLPNASADELRAIAERYASPEGAARPPGLGIFVPPHEERPRQG